MTLRTATLTIAKLSITTLSIIASIATLRTVTLNITAHLALSVFMLSDAHAKCRIVHCYSDFRYDKGCVVMLIVVMLGVNVANVILLNVVAP